MHYSSEMPRNARCVLPGIAYHVTQRGSNRERVFFASSDYGTYLNLLREHLPASKTALLAYCLMPNHVHLIAVPEEDESLAVLLRRVHGRYAQYLNARRQRCGHLWQNRYFSCPLSERHLRAALRYVERNPLRGGLVKETQGYRWSSAEAHLTGNNPKGLLDMAFWEAFGGVESWRELLAEPEEPVEVRLLRRCTYAGRPFGEEEFVKSLEERFQRRWRRWGFERGLGNDALGLLRASG